MGYTLKYYTYIHANQDGIIFYVGKGSGRRVYSMRDRSWEWQEEIKKHNGLLMKIVNRFSTEQEAFDDEQKLIKKYKDQGLILVNKNEGGAGPNGYIVTEARRKHMRNLLTGFKHKQITCPHCNKTGGETSMKRWHFDNCTGKHEHKARVYIEGKRVFLGNYATKEEATNACIIAYKNANKKLPRDFIRHKGL